MNKRENYIKIFENGNNHLDIARILASYEYYGSAISHIVLGIEELIKYQVYLHWLASPDNFKNKEVNGIFTNHKVKHDFIKEFSNSLSSKSSDAFLEFVIKSATGQQLDVKDHEVENNRFKEIGSFLNTAWKETNLSEIERMNFIDWLNKADNFKKEGFYVDKSNDNWTFPSDFKKEEFKIADRFANILRNQIKVSKDLDITDNELTDFLNSEI